jgi:hypothetical protein
MAKTLIVQITCDRCKAEGVATDAPGTESVSFAYDGYTYGIDLCADHAEEFHDTIQSLVGLATEREPLGGRSRQPRSSKAAVTPPTPGGTGPARRDKEQLQAIRDWANSHGYSVSNRGRIPGEVEAAYQASFRR